MSPTSDPTSRRLGALITSAVLAIAAAALTVAPTSNPVSAMLDVDGTISVSASTACAVLTSGGIECWGGNESGQLGRGFTSLTEPPGTVDSISTATAVATGTNHTCALLAAQTVSCWGEGFRGQLGDGTTGGSSQPTPAAVPGLGGVVQLAAGNSHTCALTEGGQVICWGGNFDGQLGNGTVGGGDDGTPTAVAGIDSAVLIGVGSGRTCAVLDDATVRCWGSNVGGALGNGNTVDSGSPVVVSGLTGVTEVAPGFGFTCARTIAGTVSCWGDNTVGQLGDGNQPVASSVPVPVPGVSGVVDIAAAASTLCVLTAAGDRWCWGANGRAELGDGTLTDVGSPLQLSDLPDAQALAAGGNTFCAVRDAGSVSCWGDNADGEAVGPGVQRNLLPAVMSPTTPASIGGGINHVCAVLGDGSVACAGRNSNEELQNGSLVPSDALLVVPGVDDAIEVTVGNYHGCALDTADEVTCWGANFNAQLGVGLGSNANGIADVGLSGVAQVSAGGSHTCAVRPAAGPDDDQLWCWGRNQFGQLGNGSNVVGNTPVEVLRDWYDLERVSAGAEHTCALDDGEAFCWGQGTSGQLGNGSFADSNVPVEVDGIGAAIDIFAGSRHSCAVTGSGQVYCWGFTTLIGGGGSSAVPQTLPITNATKLAGGPDHTCALLDDSTVTCWGSGGNGGLGNGTTGPGFVPVAVSGLTGVTDLSSGDQTCALTASAIHCWGSNEFGETGAFPFVLEPTGIALSGAVPATTTTTTTPAGSSTTTAGGSTTTVPDVSTASPLIIPVDPARLVDTRPTGSTIDGEQVARGRLDPADEIALHVAGRAGIPAGASAAVLNVTAIGPAGVGFVTAHPCLEARPLSSSLNYTPGVNLGNEVIVELDDDGNACLFTSASTHLAADVVAYLPADRGFTAVGPARLADTRTSPGAETIDGRFLGRGALAAGDEYEVEITGRSDVPADADAVVVNVTAIRATGTGYFTVHPCLDDRPNAASLNFVANVNRGSEIIAPLSADGTVCVFTSTASDLSIDVVGHITSDRYTPVEPARLLETRDGPGLETADGVASGIGKQTAGNTVRLDVADRLGIPSDADTITINLTAIQGESVGYATVHPCLDNPPNAASLNFVPGVNGGNEIIAEVDPNGRICIYTSAPVHLTADIAGYTT